MHGGKSPQALAKAEERMRELVHPSIDSLARQIKHDEFPAVKYVLDWAGFKAPVQVDAEHELTIKVQYEDEPTVIDVPVRLPLNGHTNGHAPKAP